jgi:hypothetical protein
LVVPTVAERNGDFSQTAQKPRDPETNQPFPNNMVPQTQFDHASVNFLEAFIPPPNFAGGRHIFNRPFNLDADQIMGRVDHMLTNSQRLMGRLFWNRSDEFKTAGLPVLHSNVAFDNYNIIGQHTHTLSPSLLTVAQFTFNRTNINSGPLPIGDGDGISYRDLGVNVNRGAPEDGTVELVPQYRGQVNGFWNLGQDNLVAIDRKTYQATYQVSYTPGAHLLKFGGEYRHTRSDRITGNLVDPQFNFNGQISGNAYGDFLLGLPINFSQGSLRPNLGRAEAFSFYVQDDYKIHRNFTLSVGLRYEPYFPLHDGADQISVFRPGQQSQLYPSAPSGLVYANDPGISRGGTRTDWNNWAPRLGFAWSPLGDQRTSVRGGYGVFFDTPRFFQLTNFVNSPPFSQQIQINRPRSFSDPYAGHVNPFPYTPPATDEERRNYQYLLPATIGLSVDETLAAAYNQQWNFNLQREVASDFVVTAAYVGSKATRLPVIRQVNPAIFGPGASLANIAARRIYAPNFQNISSYESTGNSTYHALQLSFNKRFAQGYTILANYTYGKAIDLTSVEPFGGQNPLDLRADKGLAAFDVRQRFLTSFLWEMPSPKSGWLRAAFGGWQTNGILTIQSGLPFTVTSGRDQALAGTGSQRPNLVGSPHLDTGRGRGELIALYYDPAAFVLPSTGTFGNSGKNTLIGPGRWNLDFALFKTFFIRESMRLQLRTEMFNAMNHANLLNPRSNISAARPGQIDSVTDPRVFQFGLRLVF